MSHYLVKITFLDHCSTVGGVSLPIECVAYGLLINEDNDAFYVASWISDNKIDENTDAHTILKKTVKSVKKIRKEKL